MDVGIQEVLLYYINPFVRPSVQTLHHFKLVENTLALPIPNEVKPGEETSKNNKTKNPPKSPKTPTYNNSETRTNIHNFKW